jgi:uncharacterized repeat protein (TIGR01451 family)
MINKIKNLIMILIGLGLFLPVLSYGTTPTLTVNKLVRNVNSNTFYLDSVSANPNETVSFSIQIRAGDSALQNLVVKDTLPPKINYLGNLKIDGVNALGNIISGITISNLPANQTTTITFDAKIGEAGQFNLGQTTLINSVLVYNNLAAQTDTAKIIVTKTIGGPATSVSTGLTNNLFLDSFFLPLTITLTIIWAFKSHIIRFEEWLDARKRAYQEYRAKKLLQMKIAKIKIQDFLRKLKSK